jgi:hypothetical protein
MKKLVAVLLLVTGCAYVPPKHIDEVHVGQTLMYLGANPADSTQDSCEVEVVNIITVLVNSHTGKVITIKSMDGDEGMVCGLFKCGGMYGCTGWRHFKRPEPATIEVNREK